MIEILLAVGATITAVALGLLISEEVDRGRRNRGVNHKIEKAMSRIHKKEDRRGKRVR